MPRSEHHFPDQVRATMLPIVAGTAAGMSMELVERCAAGSPAVAVLAFFGSDWSVVIDVEVNHPATEFVDESFIRVLVLSNGTVWAATSIVVAKVDRYGSALDFGWSELGGLQRANATAMSVAARLVAGSGPDGLLNSLGQAVEHNHFGSDPTDWAHAARLLLAQYTEESNPYAEAMHATEFLLALGSPRLHGLLGSVHEPVPA